MEGAGDEGGRQKRNEIKREGNEEKRETNENKGDGRWARAFRGPTAHNVNAPRNLKIVATIYASCLRRTFAPRSRRPASSFRFSLTREMICRPHYNSDSLLCFLEQFR